MAQQQNLARSFSPWHYGHDGSASIATAAAAVGDAGLVLPTEGAAERRRPKRVLLLYTGGTIGMKKDSSGSLAPAPGYFAELLYSLDEMRSPDMPQVDTIEYDPLLDSACFTPREWEKLAIDIGKAYYEYDGFVIAMGTDTMAYCSSALSFMFHNLQKCVVLTGSQIPISEVVNDAKRNIVTSLLIAADEDSPPEVCIFFSDRLLRGNRATKVSTKRLIAFDSPNFPHLATLGFKVEFRTDLRQLHPKRPFSVTPHMEQEVIVLRLVPGFSDAALLTLLDCKELKAIVLELYGVGNSPSSREAFLRFIKMACQRMPVVIVSQCPHGGVKLGMYAVGAALLEHGAVSGFDMTVEAAVTKVAFLLGALKDKRLVAKAMAKNLRGELTPVLEDVLLAHL